MKVLQRSLVCAIETWNDDAFMNMKFRRKERTKPTTYHWWSSSEADDCNSNDLLCYRSSRKTLYDTLHRSAGV